MADFIGKLQNLNGKNIGDIFRSLNHLIRMHDNEIKANLPYILANFTPNNDLEKLARIRLIDHYKCYDEILNILKSEDSFYISHALQCSWFFVNFNSDCHQLVESVFPYMSFTTRMKVLKKYSKLLKNTMAADALFRHLKERYGLNTAYALLPACSEGFIKDVLLKTNIQVPSCVILSIFNLYPSVVVDYITYLLQCHSTSKRVIRTFNLSNYEHIFALIAAKEPDKFAVLMEKYHGSIPYLRLGKRATRHFVQTSFDSLKNNVKVYKRIVAWKNVVSCLNIEQIANLQFSILPSSVSDFIQSYNDYCEFVSITVDMKDNIKQNILLNNFSKKYGKPITDYVDALSFELVDKLPQNIAESWVSQKLPGIENLNLRGDYVRLLPPDKAIPQLKKMIETQSDMNTRAYFVGCLASVIKKNDATNLVGPLCEYVLKRLRNDRCLIRSKLIDELASYKNLIHIPDESWVPIEELCNILLLNDEGNCCTPEIVKIISIQIHSKLKRGLPVVENIDKLLKIANDYYDFSLCSNTPYEKQCLIWFLERLAETSEVDSNKGEEPVKVVNLFTRICSWNASHCNDRIDIPDWMMDKILFSFKDDSTYHYRKTIVLDTVRKDRALKYQFYDRIFPKFMDPQILTYKLSYEPLLIKENHIDILSKILKQEMNSYNLFFKKAKLYTPFGIPKLFCSYCLSVLNNKDNDSSFYSEQKNSVIVLSLLLPTKQFVDIITEYYPKQSTIEDFSGEGRNILEIQKQITASFKSVNCPSDILESVSKFAVGDYLKFVVGSINSVCLRSPENKILPLLESWLDCPVSVRKHFIRAYFKIAPIMNTLKLLVGLFEGEQNISIRLLLFEHSLRYFVTEPSSETFSVLKAVIEKLQPSDEAAMNKLFDVENVPDEFISEYLQLLWDVVSLKNEALVMNNRNKIINLIEPEILRVLSEHFCDILISQVFDHKDVFPMDLKLFAVRYLLYSQGLEQMNRRLVKVMKGIEQLITKWNDFDLKAVYVFASRNTLSFVIDSLVRESFNVDKSALPPRDLLLKFKSNLLSLLKEDDVLEELIILELAVFFHSAPDRNGTDIMADFSNFLEPLVEKVISVYGNGVLDLILSPLIKIFNWIYSDDEIQDKQINLSEALLNKSSKHVQLLGLKILPTVITANIQRYKQILNTIFQNPDITIKAFANKMYKDLSSSVKVE